MKTMFAQDSLAQGLLDLVSNTFESYTTALFLSRDKGAGLYLAGYQSLSRNLDEAVTIPSGEGLVGWVQKNSQTLNMDQHGGGSARLSYYARDEGIRSFMAAPLDGGLGVLAVDSRQPYVFTEKKMKILLQFAHTISQALAWEGEDRDLDLARRAVDFLGELEFLLARPLEANQHLRRATAMLRAFSSAAACFIALPPEKEGGLYELAAHDTDRTYRLDRRQLKVGQGLMGWVLANAKPLILDRGRGAGEKSYLFYPQEPLGEFSAFAGAPLIFEGRLLGAMCVAGGEPFRLSQAMLDVIENAAGLIGWSLWLDFTRLELARLKASDPATGLLNRSAFVKRLNALISRRAQPLGLGLIELTNLEEITLDLGQEAADEALFEAAELVRGMWDDHIPPARLDRDVLALAFGQNAGPRAAELMAQIESRLGRDAFETGAGRVRFKTRSHLARSRQITQKAEDILHEGLQVLAKSL